MESEPVVRCFNFFRGIETIPSSHFVTFISPKTRADVALFVRYMGCEPTPHDYVMKYYLSRYSKQTKTLAVKKDMVHRQWRVGGIWPIPAYPSYKEIRNTFRWVYNFWVVECGEFVISASMTVILSFFADSTNNYSSSPYKLYLFPTKKELNEKFPNVIGVKTHSTSYLLHDGLYPHMTVKDFPEITSAYEFLGTVQMQAYLQQHEYFEITMNKQHSVPLQLFQPDGLDIECSETNENVCFGCCSRKRRRDLTVFECLNENHSLCSTCLARWLEQNQHNTTCPECRKPLKNLEA